MEHSVPYTTQKNGVAERKNISLKEMETCLLHAKNIPPSLWEKVVICASYIQNIVPHKSMVGATPFEAQEGITTLTLPFDDDDLLHVSDSDEEDQYQHYLGIEVEPHDILDPDPTSIPNQRPKTRWAQNIIVATGDGAGNIEDRRRTRSQYQNEHVSLSLIDSLLT